MNVQLKNITFLLVLSFLMSCSKTDKVKIVEEYYNAYGKVSFTDLSGTLSDSIFIIDEDYNAAYSKADFKIYYQWDSVFLPQIELSEVVENNGIVYYTLSIQSQRFEFLESSPQITHQRALFKEDKICTFDVLESVDVDWERWISKRDSLVDWAKVNHSELDGFIYDMTAEGAKKYIEAIAFYEARL